MDGISAAIDKRVVMILNFAAGLLLGLTSGIAPGPLLAFVISQALNFGAAEGAKAALAPLISDVPIIALTFFILWQLAALNWVPALLALAGAGYITWLAWGNLKRRPSTATLHAGQADSVQKSVLVNLLNPHPYLFWLTVGIPFLSQTWRSAPGAAVLWVTGFYFALVGSKLTLALVVGRARSFLTGRIYLWINRALAGVLLLFAVLLVKNALALFKIALP